MSRTKLPATYILTLVILLVACVATAFAASQVAKRTQSLRDEAKTYTDKIDALNEVGGLDGLNRSLSEVQTSVAALQQQVSDADARLAEKEAEKTEADASLAEKRADLEATRADGGASKVQKLNKELDALKGHYADLKTLYFSKLGAYSYDPKAGRVAYLTFDDGPSSNTDKILDILAKYDIKATFFVNWKEGSTAAARYKRIVAEGHTLGNHTASHDWDIVYKDPDTFMNDVHKLSENLYNLVGVYPKVVRFPGGSTNTKYKYRSKGEWEGGVSAKTGINMMQEYYRRLYLEDFCTFDWNVNSGDADVSLETKENIIDHVLSRAKNLNYNEAIVLMHDTSAKTTTVEALPEVIEGLIKLGYTFGTLSEDVKPFRSLTPTVPDETTIPGIVLTAG